MLPAPPTSTPLRDELLALHRELCRELGGDGSSEAAAQLLQDSLFQRFLGDGPRACGSRAARVAAVLDRYAFTRDERGRADGTLAVDPEALGLLPEYLSGRTAGAVYTPRTEINLMARLALVDHLANHAGEQHRPLLYEAVFAAGPDDQRSADEALRRAGLWPALDDRLRQITVLDPACGAGSFLIGMFHLLDDLRERAGRQLGRREPARARRRQIVERNLYGVDVMPAACDAARRRLWLALLGDGPAAAGPPCADVRFNIRCGDALLEPEPQRFDIVIGNPPYVRQEQIADPLRPDRLHRPAANQRYKARLAAAVCRSLPYFFGGAGGRTLDAKSDLYVYFLFRGLSLLDPRGTLCFVTSNAWLDVGYGSVLREFLSRHCRLKLVLDHGSRRTFAAAEINTVIVLCSAPDEAPDRGLAHTARFVQLKAPTDRLRAANLFQAVASAAGERATCEYRVRPVRQGELLAGGPWGGRWLRAPAIWQVLLAKGRGKLVPLGTLARIRRGYTTGANEFFYLDDDTAAAFGVESEFLVRSPKNARDLSRLRPDPAELPWRLFLCSRPRRVLRGTGAGRYVAWGERAGFLRRPTCRVREPWWALRRRAPAPIFCNYQVTETVRFYLPARPVPVSDNFFEVHGLEGGPRAGVVLNSTLVQLGVNLLGRANFGGGLLKIQACELAELLVLPPAELPLRDEEADALLTGDADALVRLDTPQRRALDAIVFDVLGLTPGERDAVYEAVFDLVSARLQKAGRCGQPRG